MIQNNSNSLTIPAGLLVSSGIDSHFVATFSLFVGILLLWTVFWGKLLKGLTRLPVIAGQIIGGILLGPSLINIANLPVFAQPLRLVDYTTNHAYAIASSDLFVFFIVLISSTLTISYLLWIAGHETDVKDILHIGTTAVGAGIFGALFPIGMTTVAANYGLHWSMPQSMGLGLIFAATSVSIPVAMLFAYNKMHLRSSKATLGAAIVDDILAVILLSLFLIGLQAGTFGPVIGLITPAHGGTITATIVYMVMAFVALLGIGYYCIPPVLFRLKARHYSHLIVPLASSVMLFYFAFAELVGGLAGITGAYFAGLFHRMGDTRHQAERVISPFVQSILLPLFLGSIGLQIDVRVLYRWDWVVVAFLLCVAIISKLIGCWVATLLSNCFGRKGAQRWSLLESYLFGSSMIARGEVGLVIATILYGSKVILPTQYVIAVIVIVLTTIVAPIMLAVGFAYLSVAPRRKGADHEFRLNIGKFQVVGTAQLFNIIIDRLGATGLLKTAVQFSEGRKIVNLEDQHVKIILCPDEGILFEGNRGNIEEILRIVKRSMTQEVQRISLS